MHIISYSYSYSDSCLVMYISCESPYSDHIHIISYSYHIMSYHCPYTHTYSGIATEPADHFGNAHLKAYVTEPIIPFGDIYPCIMLTIYLTILRCTPTHRSLRRHTPSSILQTHHFLQGHTPLYSGCPYTHTYSDILQTRRSLRGHTPAGILQTRHSFRRHTSLYGGCPFWYRVGLKSLIISATCTYLIKCK